MDASLDQALLIHLQGDLGRAESLYQSILSDCPNHADALHLLGMLRHQQGRGKEAEQLIGCAIDLAPGQAVYHSNLGLVLAAAGETDAAIKSYQTATELDPKSAEALNNLGVALSVANQSAEAAVCLRRAIVLRPDYADAQANLMWVLGLKPQTAEMFHAMGDLFHEAGNSAEAVKWYRQAIEAEPRSAESQNNLGNALHRMGEIDAAMACYQRGLEIHPDFPQACNNLGNVLRETGRMEEAVAAYENAVRLQPNSPEPLSNLANLLRESGQWDTAMLLYQQGLAIDPNHAVTHNNIGNAHCERGNWSTAITSYQRAISIKPDYADAINNLGTALEEMGERERAMKCYLKAQILDPESISPPWNIALLQLLLGDYQNGWPGYEHRWRQKKQSRAKRDFSQPMPVDLAEFKGKRILLHAEQGFGDALQFCRYVPLAVQAGAEVVLECPAALARLFANSFQSPPAPAQEPGIHDATAAVAGRSSATLPGLSNSSNAIVVARGEPLPGFDLQCPLMSFPMIHGTTLETVPGQLPYLRADPSDVEKWKARFTDEPDALRVGLVWAGQSWHQKDRHRSLSLADFAGLAEVDGVCFYSLQVGEASAQVESLPRGMRLTDWTAELTDFCDTAGLISQLDLVLTVDTAVCHLAGAIGKSVWILLAFQPDWRWLLDRNDSPWYPRTRLYRQHIAGDWTAPLKRVRRDLQMVAASAGHESLCESSRRARQS